MWEVQNRGPSLDPSWLIRRYRRDLTCVPNTAVSAEDIPALYTRHGNLNPRQLGYLQAELASEPPAQDNMMNLPESHTPEQAIEGQSSRDTEGSTVVFGL